jgi:hypothetical protein
MAILPVESESYFSASWCHWKFRRGKRQAANVVENSIVEKYTRTATSEDSRKRVADPGESLRGFPSIPVS